MKKFGGFVVFGLALLLVTSVTFADGKYFPRRMVKKTPAIPSQRAVMVYRDGVEKLIIESTLNGEGEEFGWVIPLPNVPSEFQAVTPGFVEAISQSVQPKITHNIVGTIIVIIISICVLIWFVFWALLKTDRVFINLLIVLVVVFLLAAILMPALGKVKRMATGMGYVKGVKVLDSQEIGSFDLKVLEARQSEALNEWLKVNGFAKLNEDEDRIVSGYIDDGWCFVASKLRREGNGFSVPHPLSMTFESDKAVYPMKLTGAVGSDVYLELFVIADRTATAETLTFEFCDEFKISDKAKTVYADEERELKGYVGKTHNGAAIGHPMMFETAWEGAYISRLSGSLSPGQMDEDIIVDFEEGRAYKKHYYSKRAAEQLGTIFAGAVLSGILIVGGVKHKRIITGKGGRQFALVNILLPALLVAAAAYCSGYVYVDKTEVKSLGRYSTRMIDGYFVKEMFMATYLMSGEIDGLKNMSRDEAEVEVREYMKEYEPEFRYINGAIKTGDMPGDYEVIKDERGVVVRCYLSGGFPVDFVLSEL